MRPPPGSTHNPHTRPTTAGSHPTPAAPPKRDAARGTGGTSGNVSGAGGGGWVGGGFESSSRARVVSPKTAEAGRPALTGRVTRVVTGGARSARARAQQSHRRPRHAHRGTPACSSRGVGSRSRRDEDVTPRTRRSPTCRRWKVNACNLAPLQWRRRAHCTQRHKHPKHLLST